MQPISQPNNQPQPNRTLGATKIGEPINLPMSGVLPGYRESIIYGATTPNLPWRDDPHDDTPLTQRMPPLASINENRSGGITNPRRAPLPSIVSLPSNLSTQSSNPPSLITHESTNSNNSVGYPPPRTPLESPSDRTLPPIFPSSLPGQFDVSLPPLRPPSLSPQTSVAKQLPSPNSMYHRNLPLCIHDSIQRKF